VPNPSIDPFADDIVDDPWRVEYSVPGLNESVTNKVVADIDALCRPERPRIDTPLQKALLIPSPGAGFGKSHLIGTLFERLRGRATLVNIRPFEDPETCWKSILMRIVQELRFPDRYAVADGEASNVTQLEVFAHGVLSQVVADRLDAINGNKETIRRLRQPPEQLTWLPGNQNWRTYLDEHINNGGWIGQVQQLLGRRFLLEVALESWLKVLYGYAYVYQDDWNLQQACLDWMQGDPIDDDAAQEIGIRLPDRIRVDQTASAINGLAKSRVLDLCLLAGFFRPFLICFDQTETYGKSAELASTLGTVTTDLTNEARNQLTLITANILPWRKLLKVHWQQASLARLDGSLILEGINLQQGIELVDHRLCVFDVDETRRERFWGDRQWFESLFQGSKEMSVRMFLHECSRRWIEGGEEIAKPESRSPRTSLLTLFKRYVDDISAKPRRLVYDRDTFYWLVNELAVGVEGMTVDKVTSESREHLPCWRNGDRQFVFGFESGNHWKRWHNIARSALTENEQNGRIRVYLRTPELPKIPKATWRVAKPDIEQAMRSCLLILVLDQHELVRLYAAQELHADALQGDIDWKAKEVTDFLRQELADLWQSILHWPESGSNEPPNESPNESQEHAPSEELHHAIVKVVSESRFLSLEELIDRLPGELDRETVLGVCGEATRITVHAHPNMTVVQWRH